MPILDDTRRCKKILFDHWRERQCPNTPKLDGYCLTHHPDRVAARRAKNKAAFDAKWAKRSEAYNRPARIEAAALEVVRQWDRECLKPGDPDLAEFDKLVSKLKEALK